MARYDYKCRKCKYIFEEIHGMDETPKITCPFCLSEGTSTIVLKTCGNIVTSKNMAFGKDIKAINRIKDPELRRNVAKRKARINKAKRGEDPKISPEQARKADIFAKKIGVIDKGVRRRGI